LHNYWFIIIHFLQEMPWSSGKKWCHETIHKQKVSAWCCDDVQMQVESLVKHKCIEDSSLADEVDRNWSEVLVQNYIFDRTQHEVYPMMYHVYFINWAVVDQCWRQELWVTEIDWFSDVSVKPKSKPNFSHSSDVFVKQTIMYVYKQ